MATRVVLAVVVLLLSVAEAALAQARVQATVWGGWTYSDGVIGDTFASPNGEIYTQIDTKNSGSWGIRFGVFLTRNAEAGFIYGRQPTTLEVSGVNIREIGGIAVNTYHGYFGYNTGEFDQTVRLFVFLGMGVTDFSSVEFFDFAGQLRTIPGATKFSGTFGAGVNVFPFQRVGFQANARWTPAWVTANSGSWWCDPYWGCYLGSGQYFNQVELGAGVSIRF